jgi:nucleoid-associated protein YgaU
MDRLIGIQQNTDKTTKNRTYKNIEYPSIPVDISDVYIISRYGDRLDSMAFDFYQDSNLWWVISRANPEKISRDSFFITPGKQIRIPQNINHILEKYRKINK